MRLISNQIFKEMKSDLCKVASLEKNISSESKQFMDNVIAQLDQWLTEDQISYERQYDRHNKGYNEP